jgi:WD40 repeat protein
VIAVKERIEALEEVILSPEFNSLADPTASTKGQQKLAAQLKRDSMVAASQISQKIKSTYKLKTSGKIFNKVHVRSELLGKYELHKDGVWYITSAHRYNKLLIATASADGTAGIFDLSSHSPVCSPVASYTGHMGCSVNCVKFHPKYDLLITASGDSVAHIWRPNFEQIFSQRSSDPEDKDSPDEGQVIKQPIVELTGHSSVVVGCDWLSTADQCVTASWDRNANLYDLHTGEVVMQLSGHDQELTDVVAHPASPLVVTSSNDTTFRLWDFRESIHSVCVFQVSGYEPESLSLFD